MINNTFKHSLSNKYFNAWGHGHSHCCQVLGFGWPASKLALNTGHPEASSGIRGVWNCWIGTPMNETTMHAGKKSILRDLQWQTLYLLISEGTETWWFGGERLDDLYVWDWYTSLPVSLMQVLLSPKNTDHHRVNVKARTGVQSGRARSIEIFYVSSGSHHLQ